MGIKVGLLGLGTVGTGTAKILLDSQDRHPLIGQIELARVGVRNLDKPRPVEIPQEKLTTDLDAIVNDADIDIIVEVIGGLETGAIANFKSHCPGQACGDGQQSGNCPLRGRNFLTAANEAGVYVLLEAAVGGGIPVIQPLKQALGVNRIHAVTGIINGTTNYILTRMMREGGRL